MKTALKASIPVAVLAAFAGACTHHTVETSSEIKPIHIVIDVNVKVDKDLDNYFGKAPAAAAAAAATETAKTAAAAGEQKPASADTAKTVPANVSLEAALKAAQPDTAKDIMMGRFAARRPVVKDLKSRGVVGEGSNGLLAFVGDKKESESLITVENADRKLIFDRIAKRQGTSIGKVVELRVEKAAKEALPGEYLQSADGKWTQKQ